ncbi:MAG: hypothetical protein COB36_04535 [Alphaproteobacteria bacterium]|nr:MAG: hypothetical protein COB36_04535 [Alphaproteobacteria bacterium]
MKRYSFLTSLLLCFLFAAPLYAQDNVPLRTGARDGYSRVTLGWTEKVTYSLDETGDGVLIIKFDRPAKIDTTQIDFSVLDNVSAIKVISTNPLTVSLSVPESSKVRGFKIGKRIILDIYDPSDPKDAESFKKASSLEQKKKIETTAKVVIETKPSPEKLPPAKVVEKREKTPPAFVLVPENLPEIAAPKEKHKKVDKKSDGMQAIIARGKQPSPVQKKLSNAVKEEHHVISLRATQSIDLAVFENHGALWLVMEGLSSDVIPGISSPTPEMFSPFQPMLMEDGMSYHMTMPKTPLRIKAKGGGLIWDIIMGPKVKEAKPIKPVRRIENSPDFHGDKIFWPLDSVRNIVDLADPITGKTLKVVLVEDSTQFTGAPLSYIDFDVLRSPVGMVIRPKVDDLHVEMTGDGIEIYRSSGLTLSSSKDMDEARMFTERNKAKAAAAASQEGGHADQQHKNNFFRFDEWQLGAARDLGRNENILLAGMKAKSETRRIEDLLALGKMYLSHGLGAEALGYLNYAGGELPGLHESPEFIALRGVAKALDWKSDAALEDFLFKKLDNESEVKYWKSFVLADLGDWQQAAKTLPGHYKPLHDYPHKIGHRLALVLAEVNLRAGNVYAAEELMALVEQHKAELLDPMKASLKYLRGEAYRQKNQKDKTMAMWEELTHDKDDLYRTKSGLALTILLESDGKITNDETIDRLERLRYAWRGDELEAQVNYWLGNAYFKDKKFIKGLSIMRDAADIAGDTALGQRIAGHMGETFTNLFLGEDLDTISAVDAVSLYDTFSELTPVGAQGDMLVQNLAERLVKADLLGHATKLLGHQVNHRLEGKEKLRVAIRLAAIELINKDPQKAMNALGKATDTLPFLSDTPEKEGRKGEIALLKIRAYSQNKQFDKALSLLKKMESSEQGSRLKADVAWQAGYWDEAAEFLNDVLLNENISMTRPLSQEQSDLILNRSIALSLSNDRIALGNMRAKYSDLMLQTHKARQFEVITRPRHSSALADRETLLSVVSEVDLFKDFLDSYRAARP